MEAFRHGSFSSWEAFHHGKRRHMEAFHHADPSIMQSVSIHDEMSVLIYGEAGLLPAFPFHDQPG